MFFEMLWTRPGYDADAAWMNRVICFICWRVRRAAKVPLAWRGKAL